MITYKIIKELVEGQSGFKDVSIKSRKRKYVHLRSVYYKLCYTFVDGFTLEACGLFCGGRGHDTVLHHLNDFEYVYNSTVFKYADIYHNIYEVLKKRYKLKSLNYSKKDLDRHKLTSKFRLFSIIDDLKQNIKEMEDYQKILKAKNKQLTKENESLTNQIEVIDFEYVKAS